MGRHSGKLSFFISFEKARQGYDDSSAYLLAYDELKVLSSGAHLLVICGNCISFLVVPLLLVAGITWSLIALVALVIAGLLILASAILVSVIQAIAIRKVILRVGASRSSFFTFPAFVPSLIPQWFAENDARPSSCRRRVDG